MNVFIYSLSDPRNNEVRYVGKAVNIEKRFAGHLWEEKRTDRKTRWIKSLKQLGLKPILETLEIIQDSDDNDWQERERFWITYLRFLGCRLTNLEIGGIGGGAPSPETIAKRVAKTKGQKRSDEARAKMRAAKLGKKASEETRRRMRESHRGAKMPPISEETRRRMANAQTGKKRAPFSDEHKAKIGAGNKGRKPSPLAIINSVATRKAKAANRSKI